MVSLKISSKSGPMEGSGKAMIVKLVSSPGIYWFTTGMDRFLYSRNSLCCLSVKDQASSLLTGEKLSSPKVSTTAGPAYSAASFLYCS